MNINRDHDSRAADRAETLVRGALHARAKAVTPRPEWDRVTADLDNTAGLRRNARARWRSNSSPLGRRRAVAIGTVAASGALLVGLLVMNAADDQTDVRTSPADGNTATPTVDRVPLIVEPQQLGIDDSVQGIYRLGSDIGEVPQLVEHAVTFDDPVTDRGADLVVTRFENRGDPSIDLSGFGVESSEQIQLRGTTASVFPGAEGFIADGLSLQWFEADRDEGISIASQSMTEAALVAAAERLEFATDGTPSFAGEPGLDLAANLPFLPLDQRQADVFSSHYSIDDVGEMVDDRGRFADIALTILVGPGALHEMTTFYEVVGETEPTTVRGVSGVSARYGSYGSFDPAAESGPDGQLTALAWEESPGVLIVISSVTDNPTSLTDIAEALVIP